MKTVSIRGKIDNELSKKAGRWFTVREIQDRLQLNPATLKPLIMRYAREGMLKRRHVKGTSRSVEFSPAATNPSAFKQLLMRKMPYRSPGAWDSGNGASMSRKGKSSRSMHQSN